MFCHRVLQHTPDPPRVLRHILQFVKPDGAAFVHSYARNFTQMAHWKYALRPVTTRLDPELLYTIIKWYVPPLYRISKAIRAIKPVWLGRSLFKFSERILPLYNYRFTRQFRGKSNEYILEYAIHNTFDALSPKFDIPMSAAQMRDIAKSSLAMPFEVVDLGGYVLLRTCR